MPRITTGVLRPEVASIAIPSTVDGGKLTAQDSELGSGWGNFGSGQAVMLGQGCVEEHRFTVDESVQLGGITGVLGATTFDVYLNERAYWRNVPTAVWNYRLGGYQVLKKWLSYGERRVLGRRLNPDEVQHFADTTRHIAAILRLTT